MRALAIAVALAAAVPATARAQALAVDDVVKKVDVAKAGVETLSGEFTQKNRVKLFKQELASKGRLYFRQPRQIRWEYTSPDPSVMILDGNQARLVTPGAPAQTFDLAKDATMRAIFEQLLTWLGPGSLAAAKSDYDLSATGSAAAPVLVLTPKATSPVAKAFAKIDLRLDPKTWLMKAIVLVEKNGDEKEIDFSKLARNAKLPADAFK
ncbi:MAG: outer rane lipoprotein carrier protein LolA [Myxococcales bacterium]|nr:outer rane lipoprotein carrier protein LolA [Myxococcales bacterium]